MTNCLNKMTSMSVTISFVFSFLFFSFISTQFVNGENELQMEVGFEALLAEVPIGQARTFNFTLINMNSMINVTDEQILVNNFNPDIVKMSTYSVEKINDNVWSGHFTVIPINIGSAYIHISIVMQNVRESHKLPGSMEIIVTRNLIHLDQQNLYLFSWFTYTSILITNFLLGTVMDLKKIMTFFKKPSAIITSFLFTLLVPVVSILFFK